MSESATPPFVAYNLLKLAQDIAVDVARVDANINLLSLQMTQKANLPATLLRLQETLDKITTEAAINTSQKGSIENFDERLSSIEAAISILITRFTPPSQ